MNKPVYTIEFSHRDCSENSKIFTTALLEAQAKFIKDLYKYKGYVYLSDIYELLDLQWNPYKANPVLIQDRDGELKTEVKINDLMGILTITFV